MVQDSQISCSQIIPQLNFADIQAGDVSAANKEAIRRTGVAVIRGVVPKKNAEALLADVRQYFKAHPFKGFPADAAEKVCCKRRFSFSNVIDKDPGHLRILLESVSGKSTITSELTCCTILDEPIVFCGPRSKE